MGQRLAVRPTHEAHELVVSFNPQAGPRSLEGRAREVAAELDSAGYRAHVTADLDEMAAIAAERHEAGELRAVLAFGGDGTASALRNRLPLEIPLLVVPMGTENLLGRYVSQSASSASIRETVERGVVIGLDLGRAHSEAAGQRFFLMMASAGFDAEVVRHLHKRRRGHIWRGSYVQPALETIRSYTYPELKLYCGDGPQAQNEPISCRWVFGFNLPLYARGWRLAPDAVGTDGLLDICTFRRASVVRTAWYFWNVLRGTHLQLADTQMIRGRAFRIEAADAADVAYQLDGDFGGLLPVTVELLPGMLRLLVTPAVAEELGFSTAECG